MHIEAGRQLSSRHETLVSFVHANIFSFHSQKSKKTVQMYVQLQICFTRSVEMTLTLEGPGNQGR